LNAELAHAFRHRRLDYTLTVHGFRQNELSSALRAWIKSDFEAITPSIEDVKKDYYDLIDAVRARRSTKFVVINAFSSSIGDAIFNYSAFDLPMSNVVGSIRAKELNLMLCDLARDRDVAIVDADALIAMLGARQHLPDSVHQSGFAQALLREQLAQIINARNAG
jgi:hypothetical protein